MSEQSSVLVVGAGAVGWFMAYHLNLAGARTDIYVRPSKVEGTRGPTRLYCYDDCSLKEFGDYDVVSTPEEVAARNYDYVIVTLDGAAVKSPEGTKLLSQLGDAIRDTEARIIIIAIGVGINEHLVDTTGLPGNRVLNGFFWVASHQVPLPNQPVHSPINADELAQATVAYAHAVGKMGFAIDSRYPDEAKKFIALYNQCAVSTCSQMNHHFYLLMGKALIPGMVATQVGDWKPATVAEFTSNELWPLIARAQQEMIGMKEHGWVGRLLAPLMGKRLQAKMLKHSEKSSHPLDFMEFMRYHHSGKVRGQDLLLMEDCIAQGEREGKPMPALKALLTKLQPPTNP